MKRRDALQSILAAAALPMIATTRATAPQSTESPRREPYLTAVDGTRLFVRSWGRGRPVVFVAPWALTCDWWDSHMVRLSQQGFRCVAFDRRGHGRSDESDGGYDYDTLADDLRLVIDSLDLRNVMLVGHSLGGAECARYLARDNTGRVTRAVLVAPTTPLIMKTADNPGGVELAALRQGREQLQQDRPGLVAAAAAGFFGLPGNPVPQAAIDWWIRTLIDRCSLRVMLLLHQQFTETDFRPELPRITVPTLIVHGTADTSAPLALTGRRTHELIAGSRLSIYEGAAHGLPYTHRDRLDAELIAFAREGGA